MKENQMTKRPVDNSDIGLLVAMLRFASMINRPMRDGVADPEGLSLNELRVMMSLGGEGELAGHELAELIGMQPMNVSRALATLSGVGWVEQYADPINRRRKPHRLSAAGWDAHRAMGPEVAEVAEFLFKTLDAGERQSLAAIMDKLTIQVRDWAPTRRRPHVARA
jgi:DNA-binding MarR family transcriptional regulator